ncbi:EAL domain, c-di-GMP-specific phosphodiesterase class I (or its enzymatically inactive variant) [Pseudomonas simiae]|uniref:EAL domain-containing response regulator n=1 Tax=Pseudomonas simiae TaxID=321846 RepID=UPI00084D3B43|nr:EAL domain-containing response regulator [Pseudomonas simiae]SFB39533.1 EAL domain, c-di-GMP-specific phosphodiesterase class I (or its enzymatically inactive variant) [Pseudomonas simiae]
MSPDSVVVIEHHAFQRAVLVKALGNLGIGHVQSASDAEQAIGLLKQLRKIDIVFFDLADGSINHSEFLKVAAERGNVQTLVAYSELQAELYRTVRQMKTLYGLELLGILEKPLDMQDLQRLLVNFKLRHQALSTRDLSVPELIPEDQVRHGLDVGEFEALYQPKFNLVEQRLLGVEALVCWRHPTRGMLLPRELMGAVLAYNLIDQMFKQLLDQGIALMMRLRAQGIELGMSFNLTASQLVGNELVDYTIQCLHSYDLPGSALTFEVAESSLLDLPAPALANLLRLHEVGCGLSIDDFGLGFFSLRLLAQLPLSQIKLDGVFVQDLTNPGNRSVVAGSLALTRALQIDLIIEGVGNQSVLDTLIDLGCNFGQGFHLAVPMSELDFCSWLERYQESQHQAGASKSSK